MVAAMGPGLDTARLSMMLNSLEPGNLGAFCRWLDEVEAALDTQAHRLEAAGAFELPRSTNAPRRSWPTPDVQRPADFEELRATIVAHGRDTWQMAAAVPAVLAGGWPTGLGRQFLLAVAAAWGGSAPQGA